MITSTPYQIIVSFTDSFCKEETRTIVVTFIEVPVDFPKSYNEAFALSYDERKRLALYCSENKIGEATLSAIYGISYNKATLIFRNAFRIEKKKCTNLRYGKLAPYTTWSSASKIANFVKQLKEYGIPVFATFGIETLGYAKSTSKITAFCPAAIRSTNQHSIVRTPELLVKYCLLLKDYICNSVSLCKKGNSLYSKENYTGWDPTLNESYVAFISNTALATHAIKATGGPVKIIGYPTYLTANNTIANHRAYSIEAFRSAITFLDNTINTLNQEGDQGK